MSIPEQIEKEKILSFLKIVSLLTSGYTLSTSTMTIIDHNAWGTSIWRKYAGEDRIQSIEYIRHIFDDALSFLNKKYSLDLIEGIKSALKGFASLKETYKDSYSIIGKIDYIIENTEIGLSDVKLIYDKVQNSENTSVEINHIIENTEIGLSDVKLIYDKVQNSENTSVEIDHILEEYVGGIVREKLLETEDMNSVDGDNDTILEAMISFTSEDIDNTEKDTDFSKESIMQDINVDAESFTRSEEYTVQKIYPSKNIETSIGSDNKNTPNFEQMVEISNRTSDQETIVHSIRGIITGDSTKDIHLMSVGDIICVTQNIEENIIEKSEISKNSNESKNISSNDDTIEIEYKLKYVAI
jgi:hypothetical protein